MAKNYSFDTKLVLQHLSPKYLMTSGSQTKQMVLLKMQELFLHSTAFKFEMTPIQLGLRQNSSSGGCVLRHPREKREVVLTGNRICKANETFVDIAMSSFRLLDGTRIAYQRWGKGGKHKILALHGWLDNSNSFSFLGPLLADNDYDVVAYDHVGHGHSSHIPFGTVMTFPKYTVHAKNIIDILEWEKPSVIGHSMGAGVSTMLAGSFPEIVNKLVLIEMLGPNSSDANKSAKVLRRGVEGELKFWKKELNPKVYDFMGAVNARIATVSTYPGEQTLSKEAALTLIKRGTIPVDITDTDTDPRAFQETTEGDRVRFRHDPRLLLPHNSYMTHDQVLSFIESIESKTMLITGDTGWPFPGEDYEKRPAPLQQKGLLTLTSLPGSHHLHIDPSARAAVAQHILTFLREH